MLTIIELTGERGSGKTTIANLLGEALTPASLLFIDASPDQSLTAQLAPVVPTFKLGSVFGPEGHVPGGREAIDWTFHDLTVSVGEENDLLAVGDLPNDLGALERNKLRYGLNRLMEAYDHIIIDGLHPVIHSLLPLETVRILHVLRPEQFNNGCLPPLTNGEEASQTPIVHTPTLLLNGYGEEPLPALLEDALHEGHVQLIGKIPRYATFQDCNRQMPLDFQNGLLRLNIPLSPG